MMKPEKLEKPSAILEEDEIKAIVKEADLIKRYRPTEYFEVYVCFKDDVKTYVFLKDLESGNTFAF